MIVAIVAAVMVSMRWLVKGKESALTAELQRVLSRFRVRSGGR